MANKIQKEKLQIDVALNDIHECYATFHEKNNENLNQEFLDFIYSTIKNKNMKFFDGVSLNLEVENDPSEEEKEIFKRAYLNYFEEQKTSHKIKKKRYNWLSLSLLLVGVLILFIMGMLHFFSENTNQIIYTILEIASWVFIWEAVDVFFFRKIENNIQFALDIVLSTAEINIK